MSKMSQPISTASYNADDRTNVALTYPGTAQRYDQHILTIVTTGTPSAGTVTVRIKPLNSTRWLALTDEFGVAVTITLATTDHCIIDGPIEGVQLDIASLATATAWSAKLSAVEN